MGKLGKQTKWLHGIAAALLPLRDERVAQAPAKE
jgi:hypothetical protein